MGTLCRARPRARSRSLSARTATGSGPHWALLERRAGPEALHLETPETSGGRLACVCLPDAPALVLGSTQDAAAFDGDLVAAAGLRMVRRRSGGGAVLVAPGRQLWVDLFLPAGDPLIEGELGRSFLWLGEAYGDALAAVLGGRSGERGPVQVNRGPAQPTEWSRTFCYAGLGWGEVTVAGRKVVGLSQRRQRAGCWFHSMALLSGGAGDLAGLLRAQPEVREAARLALASAGLVEAEALVDPLKEALLSRLS